MKEVNFKVGAGKARIIQTAASRLNKKTFYHRYVLALWIQNLSKRRAASDRQKEIVSLRGDSLNR